MSKVIHRHEVVSAAEQLFTHRLAKLEARVVNLESEVNYLKSFHGNTDATDPIPKFEESAAYKKGDVLLISAEKEKEDAKEA